jgi:hypothetical protein
MDPIDLRWSKSIYTATGVVDKDGNVRLPAGEHSVKSHILALSWWQNLWSPLLLGSLRTNKLTPSPHINKAGFVVIPRGCYSPQVFIQELAATGIPF